MPFTPLPLMLTLYIGYNSISKITVYSDFISFSSRNLLLIKDPIGETIVHLVIMPL